MSSWLTSNARLLMEVGAKQAAGKDSSIGAHRGAEAAHKPAGFHSDQVRCRRACASESGVSCHAQKAMWHHHAEVWIDGQCPTDELHSHAGPYARQPAKRHDPVMTLCWCVLQSSSSIGVSIVNM